MQNLDLRRKDVSVEGIRLLTVVVVTVGISLRSEVVHLVDGTALGAALNRAVLRDGEPDGVVGVHRDTSASKVLLLAVGLNGDGIGNRSWVIKSAPRSQSLLTVQFPGGGG